VDTQQAEHAAATSEETDMDSSPPPSAMVTAAAVDHVRLSYLYLDEGNLDAFASLLDDDVQVKRPDAPEAHGRAEVLDLMATLSGPPGRHELHKVIASGDCVAAMGHFVGPTTTPYPDERLDIDFVDVFTISDKGLLLGKRRYYYTAPGHHAARSCPARS
jgi:ketosteroid isomerase-like protein